MLDSDGKSFYRLLKVSLSLLSDVKTGDMRLSVLVGNWSVTVKMQAFADIQHHFLSARSVFELPIVMTDFTFEVMTEYVMYLSYIKVLWRIC